MLLGHWIEMKSVLGASRALEELVKIMPQDAHLLKDHETITVKVSELQPGDRVLIKPGREGTGRRSHYRRFKQHERIAAHRGIKTGIETSR